MKVLVTGARGMVGKAAVDHCRSFGDEVIALSRQDLDITDHTAVMKAIESVLPDAVLNCAAYTNVDGAETEKQAAYDTNVTGVENLASGCRKFDSAFVTISTDYVFDGENRGFYTQRDTPGPRGVYASTKRYGEIVARNTYARSVIVRSGWIFGSGGTNFLSIVPQLFSEQKAVKAISDCFGTPTYAADLARRLRELAELDMPCTFHVVNSGDGTSYLGYAEKVCELGGFDLASIEPVSVLELQRPSPRPVSSKLKCIFSERFGLEPLPSWEDALSRFMNF
jgi:dTDP-4-dehydrorhamnose reductase